MSVDPTLFVDIPDADADQDSPLFGAVYGERLRNNIDALRTASFRVDKAEASTTGTLLSWFTLFSQKITIPDYRDYFVYGPVFQRTILADAHSRVTITGGGPEGEVRLNIGAVNGAAVSVTSGTDQRVNPFIDITLAQAGTTVTVNVQARRVNAVSEIFVRANERQWLVEY